MSKGLIVFLTMLALLWGAAPAAAQGNLGAATGWLQGQVLADGGLSDGFSDGSSLSATIDAVFAAAAAGEDISIWGDGVSPLDHIATGAAGVTGTGSIAKLILVALSTGQEPQAFGGRNLVGDLEAAYDGASGLFQGSLIDHGLGMVAWQGAGLDIPAAAADALISFQGEDGGWSFDGVSQADTNTTGLALQALAAAGRQDDPAVTAALGYLKSQQNSDGGVPYQSPSDFGTESDANSTAWLIQGLLAVREDLADWNHPESFLASLQGESGALQWKAEIPGDNILATTQAVPALAGVTLLDLPVVPAARAPESPAVTPAATPETLPTSGGQSAPLWAAVLGLLFVLGGGTLRRWAR